MPRRPKERRIELIDGSGYYISEGRQRGRPRIDKAGKEIALAVRAHQVKAGCGYRRAVNVIAAERGLSVRHVLRAIAAFREALAQEVEMQIETWGGEDAEDEDREPSYNDYLRSCQPDLWDYLQHDKRFSADLQYDARSPPERPSVETARARSRADELREEIEAFFKLNPPVLLKPSSTKG